MDRGFLFLEEGMMKNIRAGVFGASGYAGLDLVEILSLHPKVDLRFATSNSYAGDPVPGTCLRFVPVEGCRVQWRGCHIHGAPA